MEGAVAVREAAGPERARDRTLDGPDEPLRGDARAGRRAAGALRLRRADLLRKRRALGGERLGLPAELLLVHLHRREALALDAACRRELLLLRDQRARDGVLLFGSRAHYGGLHGDAMLDPARPLASRVHLGSGVVQPHRDLLVEML